MWEPSQKLDAAFGVRRTPRRKTPRRYNSPAPHPLCLPQSLRELAVPVLLRELHRGEAVLVYGGGAGVGLQQHIRDPRSAVPRGVVKRGVTVVVDCVDVCVGLQQL